MCESATTHREARKDSRQSELQATRRRNSRGEDNNTFAGTRHIHCHGGGRPSRVQCDNNAVATRRVAGRVQGTPVHQRLTQVELSSRDDLRTLTRGQEQAE